MSQKAQLGTAYEGLLRQQLRPTEILDGIFVVGPALTLAVTSERFLIVGPTPSNGWGLKSVPWRLVTGMEVDAVDGRTIRLQYEVPAKKANTGAWASSSEPGVGEEAGLLPGELHFVVTENAAKLAALLSTRIEGAKQG